ncbi:MAG: universal stress protein [Anaerolineales bacterium]
MTSAQDPNPRLNYQDALDDFYSARLQAALEEVGARITGTPSDLLQYEQVRRRFNGIETPARELREIPLDSIIGSVDRSQDFSRKLMPLNMRNKERWVKVHSLTENMSGLPPIEVYQMGDVYFIIDGHHRASVAREAGATKIEAYVRKVITRVPISPEDDPEDLIVKAEYTDFLTKTRLDETRPDANLLGTIPGQYEQLLQYIQGYQSLKNSQHKDGFSLEQAAAEWYDEVYLPVLNVIRTRNIMRWFSDRTEADLFTWILDYRARSEEELGWVVTTRDVAENMTFNYARDIRYRLARLWKGLIRWLTPEPLEPSTTPPGFWREHRKRDEENRLRLFDTILAALPGDEDSWNALEAAIFIADNEKAAINGLHILRDESKRDEEQIAQISARFEQRCQQAGIESRMAVEAGRVSRVIRERSFWVDLVVIPLSFPPSSKPLQRLSSGIRNLIRRLPAPLLTVPNQAPTSIKSVLLAYGGGRLSDEALYMAAYLCIRFTIELNVLTIGKDDDETLLLQQRARNYLESKNIRIVTYLEGRGEPSSVILETAQASGSDMIVMGGYEGGFFKEMLKGSTVDKVLRATKCMVMVCR